MIEHDLAVLTTLARALKAYYLAGRCSREEWEQAGFRLQDHAAGLEQVYTTLGHPASLADRIRPEWATSDVPTDGPYLVVVEGGDGFDGGWGSWETFPTQAAVATFLDALQEETRHHGDCAYNNFAVYALATGTPLLEGGY